MFICQKCKKSTRPNEKLNRLVTKTREKQYFWKDKKGREKTKTGFEIVEELNLCEKCYENLKKEGN